MWKPLKWIRGNAIWDVIKGVFFFSFGSGSCKLINMPHATEIAILIVSMLGLALIFTRMRMDASTIEHLEEQIKAKSQEQVKAEPPAEILSDSEVLMVRKANEELAFLQWSHQTALALIYDNPGIHQSKLSEVLRNLGFHEPQSTILPSLRKVSVATYDINFKFSPSPSTAVLRHVSKYLKGLRRLP